MDDYEGFFDKSGFGRGIGVWFFLGSGLGPGFGDGDEFGRGFGDGDGDGSDFGWRNASCYKLGDV